MTADHHRAEGDLVKVRFQLEPGAWHGSATETLWAERIDERRLRLRNVPFYAFGVSAEDVVFAHPADGLFEFESVSIRGGHSTYRVMLNNDAEAGRVGEWWARLSELGCTFEQGSGCLRAVDVPPQADVHAVYSVLEQGEQGGIWDFEEGHYGN
ncbi:MAG TPA: DUF4265 domain-containing protein [Myxococcaceae bacterium]|nr:DUF4265 domain-containing protein [Myxococcaceae bacterium]